MYHLILTSDYELFGNGSGCVDKCIVEPTENLLSILGEYNAMCTFFVDALEFDAIGRQPESPSKAPLKRLEKQLADLGTSHHSIQLHLHPQWLGAKYESHNWILQNELWRIGDLDKSTVEKTIEQGLAYLKRFTHKPITTFRAGGWAIQPSKLVLSTLLENGIFIDSTVAPGSVNFAKGDWYNFLNSPNKPFWNIEEDVCTEVTTGNLMEIPISTSNIGLLAHFKSLREHRMQTTFPENCHGSYAGPNNHLQNYLAKASKLLRFGHVMLDFSTLPAWALIEVTKKYMNRFDQANTEIPIVAIGHNKNFSRQSEKNLEEYLHWVSTTNNIDFSSYDKFYDQSMSDTGKET